MHEIQDAAKIITESIDGNAKVIFGAINDDKLKKGELKITVIASGFDNETYKQSLFQAGGKPTETGKDDEKKTVATSKRETHSEVLTQTQKKAATKTPAEEEEDWNAIPAFLRRGKK